MKLYIMAGEFNYGLNESGSTIWKFKAVSPVAGPPYLWRHIPDMKWTHCAHHSHLYETDENFLEAHLVQQSFEGKANQVGCPKTAELDAEDRDGLRVRLRCNDFIDGPRR